MLLAWPCPADNFQSRLRGYVVRRPFGHRIMLGHKRFGPPDTTEDCFRPVLGRQEGRNIAAEYSPANCVVQIRRADPSGRGGWVSVRPSWVGVPVRRAAATAKALAAASNSPEFVAETRQH